MIIIVLLSPTRWGKGQSCGSSWPPGLTVVIVPHDLELAAQTDRVIKLRDGRVVEDAVQRPRVRDGIAVQPKPDPDHGFPRGSLSRMQQWIHVRRRFVDSRPDPRPGSPGR